MAKEHTSKKGALGSYATPIACERIWKRPPVVPAATCRVYASSTEVAGRELEAHVDVVDHQRHNPSHNDA